MSSLFAQSQCFSWDLTWRICITRLTTWKDPIAFIFGLNKSFFYLFFFYSDGVGRSGVAATVMSAIEKLKNEQTVDVLQTVNLIRVKRPFAVSDVVR